MTRTNLLVRRRKERRKIADCSKNHLMTMVQQKKANRNVYLNISLLSCLQTLFKLLAANVMMEETSDLQKAIRLNTYMCQ